MVGNRVVCWTMVENRMMIDDTHFSPLDELKKYIYLILVDARLDDDEQELLHLSDCWATTHRYGCYPTSTMVENRVIDNTLTSLHDR